jgi:hypothetical protein
MTWFILFDISFYVWAIKQYIFDKKKSLREDQEANNTNKHLTVTRKSFHFLIVIVFITGLKFDKHFLYLCSFGMLILLLLVEVSLVNLFLLIKASKLFDLLISKLLKFGLI